MVYVFGTILLVGLVCLSWIDIKTFKLPNTLNLILAILGIVQTAYLPLSLLNSLFGMVTGYAALVAVEYGFKAIRKKDGIGRGDAKLLAVGGAWCGVMALPLIVLLASLSGIIAVLSSQVGKTHQQGWIPFGPFLAFGIFSIWALGQAGFLATFM